MTVRSVTFSGHRFIQERMIGSYHSDEPVPEQELTANLWRGGTCGADIQIDCSLPQGGCVFVRFWRKVKTHAWRLFSDARNYFRGEKGDKTLIGADYKYSLQSSRIHGKVGWGQH